MAVRHPREKNGIYCGNLTDNSIDAILRVRDMEILPNFEQTIFNFPEDLIITALQSGMGVREYIKANNIDYTQYRAYLRDYQTVGVGFLYLSPRSIIGDGVGRGKTVEISALLNVLKGKQQMTRFIMAVEKSAQPQTFIELLQKTGLTVMNLPPEKNKMEKMLYGLDWERIDGLVVTHGALSSNTFLSWLAEHKASDYPGVVHNELFDTFILDESSVIKNHKSKVYENTREICKMMKRIHFMNATVFETSIMDIYNQIDMLDASILPSRSRISDTYCVHERKPFWVRGAGGKAEERFKFDLVGYKNQDQFKNKLKLYYFARHFEDETHKYHVVEVNATDEQLLAIKKGESYQAVINCPNLIVDEKYKIPFDRDHVPKLNATLNLCEKHRDKKIMIYCFYREAQSVIKEAVEKLGLKAEILNGDISKTEERQSMINRFNLGETQVIITNVKKSLNLYKGEICIIMTLESNPAKLEQIRGRIDRHVDDTVKTYYMILAKGTPEYRLYMKKLRPRQESAKELTTNARSAVDYFVDGEVIQDFLEE